jgi:hypothetical protein
MNIIAKITAAAAGLMLIAGTTAGQARTGLTDVSFSGGLCAGGAAGCVLPVKKPVATPVEAAEAAVTDGNGFPFIPALLAAAAVIGGIVILSDSDDDDTPTSP